MAVDSPDVAQHAPEAVPPPPAEPPPFTSPLYARPFAPPPARRQRNRLLWYLAVSAAIVITLGAFGLLYVDDQSWQRQAGQLRQDNSSLHDQLQSAQADASDAQQQVKDLQGQLAHPTMIIWNVPEDIKGPNEWLEGGIPDTFTYHLRATSTGPMTIVILTYDQYAAAFACADAGRATSYECFTSVGATKTFTDVTSVNYDFHLAEGCAGYLAVWLARGSITVNPEVGVTYNPAPTFTGVC